ncbi:MAG: hypothetical protein K2F72_06785 [Muribaculaceae bacterium]|nr:hypothetical protein [Muribaculaceae bacterium]
MKLRLILTIVAALAALVARAQDEVAATDTARASVPWPDAAYVLELIEEPDTAPARPERPNPYDVWEERKVEFNPDPTRAVWMSALFPGMGQVYNRRYWKLPIIVGGYLALGYATSWNNSMLDDYSKAYRDITDNDPTTKSYMDFFPPTVQEESLDKTWLTSLLQSRKNFYRRNRDLCIISMVGGYLLAMVDAYVDASLSHFDISPDLSMDVAPAVFREARGHRPAFGLQWALNF